MNSKNRFQKKIIEKRSKKCRLVPRLFSQKRSKKVRKKRHSKKSLFFSKTQKKIVIPAGAFGKRVLGRRVEKVNKKSGKGVFENAILPETTIQSQKSSKKMKGKIWPKRVFWTGIFRTLQILEISIVVIAVRFKKPFKKFSGRKVVFSFWGKPRKQRFSVFGFFCSGTLSYKPRHTFT